MRVEIHLKKLLQKYNLYKPGVAQDIAAATLVHRHTIGKLLRNQMTHPSLVVLGEICEWLIAKGVPPAELAGELFFIRPSRFWEVVTAPGKVRIYLGEHLREGSQKTTDRDWISRRDGMVALQISQRLSKQSSDDVEPASNVKTAIPQMHMPAKHGSTTARDRRPEVEFAFVMSPHTFKRSESNSSNWLNALRKDAEQKFADLRKTTSPQTSILIGSQRTNILTECLVADAYGCKPFVPMHEQECFIPFFLTSRPEEIQMPSCFGGAGHPAGPKVHTKASPGIWYLTGDSARDPAAWRHCPWEMDKKDAGIALIVRDEGSGAMEVAIFGFSGSGTAALGTRILQSPETFWKTATRSDDQGTPENGRRKRGSAEKKKDVVCYKDGKEIIATVCEFTFRAPSSESVSPEVEPETFKAHRLGEAVIPSKAHGSPKKIQ